jgi:hypothetical protein
MRIIVDHIRFKLALLALWVGAPVIALAQIDPVTTTRHEIRLSDGHQLAYEVQAGRVPIRDGASEEVHGYMFFVAYRATAKDSKRPVTVLWNGGPGGNSSTLHLESIGPKRIENDGRLLDFDATALETTDLVFVDAIGTGFSRAARREFTGEFYQTRGDVAAFTEFVRAWRSLFSSPDVPLFIGGESWGSYRAGAVAYALEQRGIHVSGLILISGRTGLPAGGPAEAYVALRVAQLPGIALFYNKLSPSLGTDVEAITRRATQWALETYTPALARLATLSGAERDAIALQLAAFSGFEAGQIDRGTLVITPQQYLNGLLHDQGKAMETFDMRKVKPDEGAATAAQRRRLEAVKRYLRQDLAYRSDLAYLGTGSGDSVQTGYAPGETPLPDPNTVWDYTQGFFTQQLSADEIKASDAAAIARGEPPGGQAIPLTERAIALNPDMHLLIVNGRDDSMVSCASTAELLRRLEPPLQARITFHCYPGGHQIYRDPDTRRQFSADLQKFEAAVRAR